MFRYAFVALAVLFLWYQVEAAQFENWETEGNCNETAEAPETSFFDNDTCRRFANGYIKGYCLEDSDNTAWTVYNYKDSPHCTGDPFEERSHHGNSCISSAMFGGLSIRIRCGVDEPPKSGCFSGNNFATLESGEQVPFGALQVGDKVLAVSSDGSLFFDRIFRRSSWHPEAQANFIEITTASGHWIELSAEHFLHVNDCCSLDNMKLAAEVQVGDTLFVVGDNGVVASEVVSVKFYIADGVYNVHTLSGAIVVNGVSASHFTTETTWNLRSWAPVWYRVADFVYRVTGFEV